MNLIRKLLKKNLIRYIFFEIILKYYQNKNGRVNDMKNNKKNDLTYK